ncbi:MAG: ABC transporter substrate-binding protein [Flavobacteriales bacterium]|nr:ABC transporter substrate-binding protein [Flavobacteriales bacterium]MCB9449737.1 ABC transporter substrate-binding protein [Flavobacteriales bacterium]
MRKFAILFSVTVAVLAGCKGGSSGPEQQSAKGGVKYGGVFRINEEEDFRNLFPLKVNEIVSQRIANQVYEGLIDFNQKDLSLVPGLAESWTVNDSATVFTFKLRHGVYFQDDACFPDGKGREMKAEDVKYCFTRLCTSDPMNAGFWVFRDRVVGANEYYQSTVEGKPLADGVKGVKVMDDYTLEVDLLHPYSSFLNILAMPFTWVFPKEAFEKYGVEMRVKCVGTGPFKVKEVKDGETVILSKNENYWGVDKFGNKLPYLDAIQFTFVKEKKSEFLEFKKQNLDMVFRLPVEMIDDILDELENAKGNLAYDLQITPAMSNQYYGFLQTDKVFSDVRVRKAFNYAIDRKKIINYTLRGEGIPGNHGFVPPSFRRTSGDFKGYDAEAVKGYDYNPDEAKRLLADAGYPNGKGFPRVTLQLNSGGARNIQVAEVIQNMLSENLGISVEMNVMPFAQHLENVESAKTTFWRGGWVSDYPDPDSFLNLFYGAHVPASLEEKSYINTFRFKNAAYDSLFAAAMSETNEVKRFDLYRQCDQMVMDNAVVMMIYYDENYRLLQHYVRNFPINPIEYRKFNEVYFDKSAEGANQAAAEKK